MNATSRASISSANQLFFPPRLVGILGQIVQEIKKLFWLAVEEPVGRKPRDRALRRAFGFGGANDGDDRELAVEEVCRLRHDQVGLEFILIRKFRGVCEVREKQRGIVWIDQGSNRRVHGVPGFVVPGLEVRRFGGTDAEQDAQNLRTGHALRQRRIKAGAALLDKCEVKSGGEGDGFQMVGAAEISVGIEETAHRVGIRPGNRRAIVDVDRLREHKVGIEIGVLVINAVARPKAGVHREVH
jgi:hypothetical protein